jgi:hypothetical protein
MPKIWTMKEKPTEIKVNISDSLTEEELKDIRLFLKKADELSKTRIMTGADNGISMRVSSEIGKTPQISVTLPDEEYLRSFYMAFRMFYSQDATNFNRIANIVKRRSGVEGARKYVDALKERWSGALARQQFHMEVDGQEMTPSLLMDLWFNAHYFHPDEGKDEKLSALKSVLTHDGCRFMLADAVYEASVAVLRLAHSLKALEEKKS